MRLDKFVSEKFAMTRNRAQFCIDSGLIVVNGKAISKAAYDVKENDIVEMYKDKKTGFVARSAVKLDDFLENKKLDVKGCVCLDVGASTGGFTQVLLQRGAKQVIAVDVGTSQLHESLKNDFRVISLENTDIRTTSFEEKFDLIVVDVSFISLRKIVPSLQKIMRNSHPELVSGSLESGRNAEVHSAGQGTQLILLFKPQFEVGKANLKKTGVPKDEKIIKRTLDDFCVFLRESGLKIQCVEESSLPGEAGNKEWFIRCQLGN